MNARSTLNHLGPAGEDAAALIAEAHECLTRAAHWNAEAHRLMSRANGITESMRKRLHSAA